MTAVTGQPPMPEGALRDLVSLELRFQRAEDVSCEVEPDLWPIRPRPLPGEVFTGWIARVAQGHGVEPRVFLTYLRSRFRLESDRDLDMNPSYELLAEVSRRTAIRYDRLVVMTLRWHAQAWYARQVRCGHTGSFGFCPLCWAQDSEPYIRRPWRLPWMPCTAHRTPLRWECPQCHRPTNMGLLDAAASIWICTRCGIDLRSVSSARWLRTITEQETRELIASRRVCTTSSRRNPGT